MLLQSIWRNPVHFIACGFGTGAMPFMPGTFGSVLGVVLYLMLAQLPLAIYLVSVFLLLCVGVYLCHATNKGFGIEDSPAIVWDELASFPIVMIAIPLTWYYVLAGFLLFRIFDIAKPWPIGWFDENIHGGLGVMLDDVIAALFSWAVLYIITLI